MGMDWYSYMGMEWYSHMGMDWCSYMAMECYSYMGMDLYSHGYLLGMDGKWLEITSLGLAVGVKMNTFQKINLCVGRKLMEHVRKMTSLGLAVDVKTKSSQLIYFLAEK